MADDSKRPSSAPEGARCAEHRERIGHFTCPRCGSYACVICWHPSIERCQQCINSDPSEAAPPIAWETREGFGLQRYARTLLSAFSPVRSAPAFANDDVASARSFMLLTALPLALLAGVIPHTRTLLFEGNFAIRLQGSPSSAAIAQDVLFAALVQVGLSGIGLICLLLPYVTLVHSYARPDRRTAAIRVLYYRYWLMPAALLFYYVLLWALPAPDPKAIAEQAPPLSWALVSTIRVLTPVLLFVAMGSTARLACGLGPLLSLLVVMVPVVLLLLVEPLAEMGAQRLLPPLPPPPADPT